MNAQDDPRARFLAQVEAAFANEARPRLILDGPGEPASLRRLRAQPIEHRGARAWQWVEHHVEPQGTHDHTRILSPRDGLDALRACLATGSQHLHLLSQRGEFQLTCSRKGRWTLRVGKADASPACAPGPGTPVAAAHNRLKPRHLRAELAHWQALGVTDAAGQVLPAMSRKWKQVDKFAEILNAALVATGLDRLERLRVVDYGCGRGVLTFGAHELLCEGLGLAEGAEVLGVEWRANLVADAEAAARTSHRRGLHFVLGDLRSVAPADADVVIALHACDTATDHALHLGVSAGARVLIAAPCCHRELRPQMKSPAVLAPVYGHGIHLGQEAEMLTDALRALLLQTAGYDTQVIEFISLEHTAKNKMIVATRRAKARDPAPLRAQIAALKDFWGLREHHLERLLAEAPPPASSLPAAVPQAPGG